MTNIIRNLARPYLFVLQDGGIATVLALLFSVVAYGKFYQIPAPNLLGLLNNFLTEYRDPLTMAFKLVSFMLFFSLLYFLFKKTFLKFFNNALFNYVALGALLYLLYIIQPLVFYITVGIGLFLLIFKYLIKGGDFIYDFSGSPYGDSRWSRFSEIRDANLASERGFVLGRDEQTGRLIGFEGEGHVLTVAKTGAGKGVGVVIPNLLHYHGSILVIDPKGENFIRTVYARTQCFPDQEICLIDPFKVVHQRLIRNITRIDKAKSPSSSMQSLRQFYEELLPKVKPCDVEDKLEDSYYQGINPMQLIEKLIEEENYQEVFDQANMIANMLIVKTANDGDPHWNEKAKMVIKNAIIFYTLHENYRDDPNNLVEIKDFVTDIFADEESFENFLALCEEGEFAEQFSRIGAEFSMMQQEERMGVLSTVMRHLEFIDSPLVNDNLIRSDFNLLDLKQKEKTVYLVLPANKLDSYSRLMRLWIASLVNSISLDLDIPRYRILMMLDEMAQLGYMEPLIQAVSLLRGYGLNMWMIFQDISQMKSIYGDKWKTFSSNAKIQQFFGVSDDETAEYVSKLSGNTTIITRQETFNNTGGDIFGNNASHSYNAVGRNLLYPDQLYRTDLQFLFTDNLYPIKARKIKFYQDGIFRVGEHLPIQVSEETKDLF